MTTTTDLRDALRPSTKAGWALLGREALNSRSFTLINATDILAIEEEAASIVRDERSAEVAALVEAGGRLAVAMTTALLHLDHEHPGWAAQTLRAALAQTPPTDAGRVERCTFEHAWGDCGGERGFWRHDRATAKAAGDLYHPFRPAPITEDALAAALRDILREYVYQPFGAPEAKEAHAAILAAIREGTR